MFTGDFISGLTNTTNPRGLSFQGSLEPQQSPNCAREYAEETGNTTDSDNDGVSVNSTYTVDADCTFSWQGTTYHWIIQGKLWETDANDSDPWVWKMGIEGLTGTQFFIYDYSINGSTTRLRYKGEAEGKRVGNTYCIRLNDFQHQATPPSGPTFYLSVSGEGCFTPQNPSWQPGDPVNGRLTLEYQQTWHWDGGPGEFRFTVTTPDPLELRSTCYNYVVDGTIRLGWQDPDGHTYVLEIDWTSCGNADIYYNGGLVGRVSG
ncbi:hypothetical protein [Thermus sp. LT1-2-5]|uniref:hypothetical protein n=1 Tax=Thermus sp. LT1-2-5 TaxID=3026935 RepID=UPI003365849A